jgi:phosphate transport system permease protein
LRVRFERLSLCRWQKFNKLSLLTLILLVCGAAILAFLAGRRKAIAMVGGARSIRNLHSLPDYYGYYTGLWCALPGILLIGLWLIFSETLVISQLSDSFPAEVSALPPAKVSLVINDIRNMAGGQFVNPNSQFELSGLADLYVSLQESSRHILSACVLFFALLGFVIAWNRLSPELRARNAVERVTKSGLVLASTVAVFTTVGILFSVVFEALLFFQKVSLTDFLFGLEWSPQTAIREDQVGSSGSFGAVPLFVGTMLISGIAMLIAVPMGLMTAIYLSEYATRQTRAGIKPVLEVLAGIPTVVYGYFAALTVAPLLRDAGEALGLSVASESALGAGLVMGVMIIPFVSSISDDVINAVPQAMRDASYGLGATRSETIKRVVVPAALPGIVSGVLLAASRAIGETMIVVMAAGLAANLTINPLEAVTTVTVQIVTLLVGDQEFDSAKTLAAFALGLMLFIVTLILNIIALAVVRRYREQYE